MHMGVRVCLHRLENVCMCARMHLNLCTVGCVWVCAHGKGVSVCLCVW